MNFQQSQKPLLLSLMVLLAFALLSFIPQFSIGTFSFREMDWLSSVRPDEADSEYLTEDECIDDESGNVQYASDLPAADSAAVEKSPCKPGLTCIEDFSDDQRSLAAFAEAMQNLKSSGSGKVRIAFYGDSFIEGDIFCGSVRDSLQTLFGGRGVGFVPITSRVIGFRNTIRQNFDRWETYSIIEKRDSIKQYVIGPAGYCFKPRLDNWVEFRGSRQRYLRQFESVQLFYRSLGESYVHYTINDTLYRVAQLQKGKRLREWKKENIKARKIEFTFENPDSIEVYGASFEGGSGVYVDNFAMRGNSGIGLDLIPTHMLSSFNKYRDYKLIILQYGLNALNFDSSRYAWYSDRMVTVIERLKEIFPDASIVLLSVSDRSSNVNGTYKTIRSIPTLRNTQRNIAKRTKIAFWDLYQAMGGENSMVEFVKANPALAAKDYTHLTFKGGKRLAGELVGSLMHEIEKYERIQQLP